MCLEPNQTSLMKLFEKIVTNFSRLLFWQKGFIIDVRRGSKQTFGLFYTHCIRIYVSFIQKAQ